MAGDLFYSNPNVRGSFVKFLLRGLIQNLILSCQDNVCFAAGFRIRNLE